MANQLSFDFFEMPEIKPALHRRITRSYGKGDDSIITRSDRLAKRNRTMVARYYYWAELKRRRFDDTIKILADNEFFIDDRTVSNILVDYDDYLRELLNTNATRAKLRDQYPGWSWA